MIQPCSLFELGLTIFHFTIIILINKLTLLERLSMDLQFTVVGKSDECTHSISTPTTRARVGRFVRAYRAPRTIGSPIFWFWKLSFLMMVCPATRYTIQRTTSSMQFTGVKRSTLSDFRSHCSRARTLETETHAYTPPEGWTLTTTTTASSTNSDGWRSDEPMKHVKKLPQLLFYHGIGYQPICRIPPRLAFYDLFVCNWKGQFTQNYNHKVKL